MKSAEATKPLIAPADPISAPPEASDSEIIAAVLRGETEKFGALVVRYQPKIFGMVRRYARRETDVQDVVQEIFLKVFQKLSGFRADAPFEHWLMRLAVRVCYDFLRERQRNREFNATDLTNPESDADVLDGSFSEPRQSDRASAASQLVEAALSQLSPAARMAITLLEIEERSIKEISKLTGWSETLVKVRAFRARAELKKVLAKIEVEKYL